MASGQSADPISREFIYLHADGLTAAGGRMRHYDSSPSLERDELEQQIEALRRDIRRLQLEQDILKKANELPKDLGC